MDMPTTHAQAPSRDFTPASLQQAGGGHSHLLRTDKGGPVQPRFALWPKGLIIDVEQIPLNHPVQSRSHIENYLPHRGDMLQLDEIVWHSDDYKEGIAVKHVRENEFWVPGHFPERPVMPGVLQVEASAQLAVYLYNARQPEPQIAAFTRLEECSFRSMVVPGDELYLLCREIKYSRRGFTCSVQGIANNKLTFEAQIQGLAVQIES